jgi:hypothetical protein
MTPHWICLQDLQEGVWAVNLAPPCTKGFLHEGCWVSRKQNYKELSYTLNQHTGLPSSTYVNPYTRSYCVNFNTGYNKQLVHTGCNTWKVGTRLFWKQEIVVMVRLFWREESCCILGWICNRTNTWQATLNGTKTGTHELWTRWKSKHGSSNL